MTVSEPKIGDYATEGGYEGHLAYLIDHEAWAKDNIEEKSNFELFVDWLEINHKKDFKRTMKLFQEWLWSQNKNDN